MEIGFEGRTVIVTGAVRGIGRGIAHAFAARGAVVYGWDIEGGLLEEVAATAEPARGGAIHTAIVDVTDEAAVREAVAGIEGAAGPVDIAIHSAGGTGGQSAHPIEAVTAADWRAIQAVNVDGAFHLAKAVAPGMKRAGSGRIVIIASIAAFNVSLTGIHSYGTAKAAQLGLVRQLASEFGPHGVTVNAVAPGFMPTSPAYVRQWESYGPDGQRALIERTAMRRLGRPADIAHAVMFLASFYAGWITGQTLRVNGGP